MYCSEHLRFIPGKRTRAGKSSIVNVVSGWSKEAHRAA